MYETLVASQQHLTVSEKASKIYGVDVSSAISRSNSNQQISSTNHYHSSSANAAAAAPVTHKKTNMNANADTLQN